MARPALQLDALRATVQPQPLLDRRLRLDVHAGLLRLSARGITLLLPTGVPLRVDRIGGGRLHLVGTFRGMEGSVELRPGLTASGHIGLEPISARAGFFPLPIALVTWALRNWLPENPGLRVADHGQIEVDLAEILGLFGVSLPPLSDLVIEDDLAELHFGERASNDSV